MTGPHDGEGIHQVFFGWSYDTQEHTIVASSFDVARQGQWRRRLQDHTRLQPVRGFELPETALSCLEFKDGSAAIVRRVRNGNSSGRNNAHVLIGPAAVLGASLALRLERWEGWQDTAPPGAIGTIAPSWLEDCAGPPERSLAQVRPFEKQLEAAIARLLDYPDAPLSIIGCPDEHRLPMVWALHTAAAGHLAQVSGVPRRWTFSTYEDRHAAGIENLPEIVFLPAVPGTAEPHNRAIVRYGEQPPSNSPSAAIAAQLVAGLLHNAPPPVVTTRPINDVGSRPGPDQGLPPAPQVAAAVRHQTREVVVGQQSSRHVAKNARALLVDPLLGARNVKTFCAELQKLLNLGDRDQLRQVFHVDAANKVAEFVEFDARQELITMLLKALYGPDFQDLQDRAVREHAAQLVKKCRSEQLAVMLGAGAAKHARFEVSELAFDRWARFGAPLKRIPRRRVDIRLPWEKVRRRWVIWSLVAAILLLVSGFVGGYVLGRPATGQPLADPAVSRTTTSPPTVATQDPKVPANKFGTVQLSPNQNQQVFAFARVGTRYYPQGACTPVDGGKTKWRCEQVYEPPLSPGFSSELVAILVTTDEATRLVAAVAQKEERRWTPGVWVSEEPVVP